MWQLSTDSVPQNKSEHNNTIKTRTENTVISVNMRCCNADDSISQRSQRWIYPIPSQSSISLSSIYFCTTDDHSVFINRSNMSRRRRTHQGFNVLRRRSALLEVCQCIKRMSNCFPTESDVDKFIFETHLELDYSLFCYKFDLRMWFIPSRLSHYEVICLQQKQKHRRLNAQPA